MASDWSTRPELLDGDAQRGEVGAAAAVLLGEREAEQAELAHRQHDVDRGTCGRGPSASACGAISPSAKSRTTLRKACCSSVNSTCTPAMRTAANRAGRAPARPYPRCVAFDAPPLAVVGGRLLTGLVDVTSDLAALEGRGLWAVVLPFDGEPGAGPLRASRGRPARGPGRRGAAPIRRAWTTASTARAFCAGRRRHPRRHRRRRRLPGQPHPPAVRAAAAGRRHRRPRRRPRPRATRRRTRPSSGCRPHGVPRGVGLARALPPPRRRPRRLVAHQGHRRRPVGLPRQGPGRERDDRRPRAQRPRPGVRVGLGRGAGAVRGRAAPRPRPPGVDGDRPAAAGRDLGRRRSPPRSRPGR